MKSDGVADGAVEGDWISSVWIGNDEVDSIAGVEIARERSADAAGTCGEVHHAASHDELVRFVEWRRLADDGLHSELVDRSTLRYVDDRPEAVSACSECTVGAKRQGQVLDLAHPLNLHWWNDQCRLLRGRRHCVSEGTLLHGVLHFRTTITTLVITRHSDAKSRGKKN